VRRTGIGEGELRCGSGCSLGTSIRPHLGVNVIVICIDT
jgi:hypothetical protein